MFTTLITFVAAFVVAGAAAAAEDLSMNTPHGGVTECKEVTFTWQGGKAPYTISVLNADEPCDAALVEFPSTTDTWLHWFHPNITGKLIVAVEDHSGDEAWTQEMTVQKDAKFTCPPPAAATASASSTGVTLVPAATPAVAAPPTVPSPASGSGGGNGGPAANVGAISGASRVPVGVSVGLASLVGVVSFFAL